MADKLDIRKVFAVAVVFVEQLLHPVFTDTPHARFNGVVNHLDRHRFGGGQQRNILALAPALFGSFGNRFLDVFEVFLDVVKARLQRLFIQ